MTPTRRGALLLLLGALGLGTAGSARPAEAQRFPYPPLPPPRYEPVPPGPPRGRQVRWQPGHWHWNGRAYVWVPGRWVPITRRRRWAAGRWRWRGGVWVWVPGGWY